MFLDDMRRYIDWLNAGIAQEGEVEDHIEKLIQEAFNEDRSEEVRGLLQTVKTELQSVLDAIGGFDRPLRTAISTSLSR